MCWPFLVYWISSDLWLYVKEWGNRRAVCKPFNRWIDLVNGVLEGSKFRVCAWEWGGGILTCKSEVLTPTITVLLLPTHIFTALNLVVASGQLTWRARREGSLCYIYWPVINTPLFSSTHLFHPLFYPLFLKTEFFWGSIRQVCFLLCWNPLLACGFLCCGL